MNRQDVDPFALSEEELIRLVYAFDLSDDPHCETFFVGKGAQFVPQDFGTSAQIFRENNEQAKESLEWFSKTGIPVAWAQECLLSPAEQKLAILQTTVSLLKVLPSPLIRALAKGGVRYISWQPTLGGYYQVKSSTIHINIDSSTWEHSIVHELGHLNFWLVREIYG